MGQIYSVKITKLQPRAPCTGLSYTALADEVKMAMAEKSEADAESLAAISEKAVVESLGKLSGSLSCRFSCGGELSSPDKIQLVYKNEAGELRELVFPEASDADMQQLLDACSVASFGIDDQQVTDTSYRNALKLDPDHFTTSFQVADTPIQLAAMLLMPNVQGIRAELYKLNIYSSGGFFKAHVDTPRSDQMFGSLVVCLPTQFCGGALVTRHHDHEVKFDWSSPPSSPRKTVSWAVFFSDVEHEVLPVTQGHRITLTYNLYVMRQHTVTWEEAIHSVRDIQNKDAVLKKLKMFGRIDEFALCRRIDQDAIMKWCGLEGWTEAISCEVEDVPSHDVTINPLYKELSAALGHPYFMRGGGVLGFSCHHRYVYTDLNSTSSLPGLLKGADQIVYFVAKSLGLSVIVKPVVYNEWEDPQILFSSFHEFQAEEGCLEDECSENKEITYLFGEGHHVTHVTWCQKLNRQFGQAAGCIAHYGNQPSANVFYQTAAILVGIPEWGDIRKSCTLGSTQETSGNENLESGSEEVPPAKRRCSQSKAILEKLCFHGEMPQRV